MGDDSFVISWGADDEPGARPGEGHPADPQCGDRRHRQGCDPRSENTPLKDVHQVTPSPGHIFDQAAGPELGHGPQVGDHPCLQCGEEHRAQEAGLKAQVQEWKQRADEYEIKAALNERHLDDVKQSRMEFRNEVTLLEAELAQVQAELERARRPWWRRLMGR